MVSQTIRQALHWAEEHADADFPYHDPVANGETVVVMVYTNGTKIGYVGGPISSGDIASGLDTIVERVMTPMMAQMLKALEE